MTDKQSSTVVDQVVAMAVKAMEDCFRYGKGDYNGCKKETIEEVSKELRALLDAPVENQGAPVAYKQHPSIVGYARKKDLAPLLDETQPEGSHIYLGLDHPVCWAEEPPYDHLIALFRHTQPTTKVTLPKRLTKTEQSSDEYDAHADSWNACLDEVAKLNGVKP